MVVYKKNWTNASVEIIACSIYDGTVSVHIGLSSTSASAAATSLPAVVDSDSGGELSTGMSVSVGEYIDDDMYMFESLQHHVS